MMRIDEDTFTMISGLIVIAVVCIGFVGVSVMSCCRRLFAPASPQTRPGFLPKRRGTSLRILNERNVAQRQARCRWPHRPATST